MLTVTSICKEVKKCHGVDLGCQLTRQGRGKLSGGIASIGLAREPVCGRIFLIAS